MGRTLPRVGFGVPVGQWIRGPLHPWAEELEATRMKAEGWFDAAGSGAAGASTCAARRFDPGAVEHSDV